MNNIKACILFVVTTVVWVCGAGTVAGGAPVKTTGSASATMVKDSATSPGEAAGYTIEKPGTITFTVGVKIKGKVERPQVMIFLPKEKPYYARATFSYSFSDDIMKPMEFVPLCK